MYVGFNYVCRMGGKRKVIHLAQTAWLQEWWFRDHIWSQKASGPERDGFTR